MGNLKMKHNKIIVSLTSFPGGMGAIVPVLRSLLVQTVRPDKIILYLTDPEFPTRKIPNDLELLVKQNPILEIRFYPENIRSYTKLIPVLQDFPDDIIITVDDDVLYPDNIIEQLLLEHKKNPQTIISHRVRKMRFDRNWNLLPYETWKIYKKIRYLTWGTKPKYINFLTGTGGVLYPPHSLHPDVLNQKLFCELAPTADDVWFWAMAVLNGTKTKPVRFGNYQTINLDKPLENSLLNVNLVDDRNGNFARNIIKKYPEIMKKIKNKNEN